MQEMGVKKIKSCYVGDDCVQIMFAYNDGLTILSPEGVVYHENGTNNEYINKYLDDERRKKFPYSDIPMHKELFGFKITNQILDFNKSYLRFFDGNIVENYVVKDGNEALIVDKIHLMQDNKRSIFLDFLEREEYVIVKKINKLEKINKLIKSRDENTYFLFDSLLIPDVNYINDIPENKLTFQKVQIADGKFIIDVIKLYQENFSLNLEGDCISISSKHATLEQLKYLSGKIKTCSNPNISPLLNPNISKEVIKKNKMLAKKFR